MNIPVQSRIMKSTGLRVLSRLDTGTHFLQMCYNERISGLWRSIIHLNDETPKDTVICPAVVDKWLTYATV